MTSKHKQYLVMVGIAAAVAAAVTWASHNIDAIEDAIG